MLFYMLHTISDFVALLTRLMTEDLADEQRIVLIDQFIHHQGLETTFQFNLHDLPASDDDFQASSRKPSQKYPCSASR
jgi:hypothetical protein